MKTSLPGVYAVNSAHILKGNLNVNETIQIAESAIQGELAPDLRSRAALTKDAATEMVSLTERRLAQDERTHRQLVARSG
jgi:hypothetical protein